MGEVSESTADLIRALVERGAHDEAQKLAHEALRGAAGVERAELLLAQAFVHGNRGEQLQALAAAVEAGELFQAAGLQSRTCDALVHTAGTLRVAGDHETALSTLEHAETLARGAGDDLRRYYHLWRARIALIAAGGAALIFCLLLSSLKLYEMYNVKQQMENDRKKEN